MGVKGLFDGLDLKVGSFVIGTPGEGVDRAEYAANLFEELESGGFVTSYDERDETIYFCIEGRINQNA